MNRSATASLHSATPKKNVPCFSDLAVVKFFLKKERTFFFGVLPSKYSGKWRGDNSIRSGMAEFPPHPPSAMPSLGRTEILAATSLYLFHNIKVVKVG